MAHRGRRGARDQHRVGDPPAGSEPFHYLGKQPGPAIGAASDHHGIGTGLFQGQTRGAGVGDVAVHNQRQAGGFFHVSDSAPVRRAAIGWRRRGRPPRIGRLSIAVRRLGGVADPVGEHEVGDLLPPVNERVVMLDGSYQDQLSMNLFSMMIIFNSVQSQRTDMDYFFHPRQRRSLLEIVHNLKQSTFFGGSFFASDEIAKAIQTAEEFLQKKKVPISCEDESLLKEAIQFGHVAMVNTLKNISNQFHELPVCVQDFPGGAGQAWSLTDEESTGDMTLTSASLLLALQKLVYNTAGELEKFNALLNGGFVQEGMLEKQKLRNDQSSKAGSSQARHSQTLAGNTKLGGDSAHKARTHGVNGIEPMSEFSLETFAGRLESTRILATVSAKMSYLLDELVKHQENEKIIVFYENENIAWYIASMLDVVRNLCLTGTKE